MFILFANEISKLLIKKLETLYDITKIIRKILYNRIEGILIF